MKRIATATAIIALVTSASASMAGNLEAAQEEPAVIQPAPVVVADPSLGGLAGPAILGAGALIALALILDDDDDSSSTTTTPDAAPQ